MAQQGLRIEILDGLIVKQGPCVSSLTHRPARRQFRLSTQVVEHPFVGCAAGCSRHGPWARVSLERTASHESVSLKLRRRLVEFRSNHIRPPARTLPRSGGAGPFSRSVHLRPCTSRVGHLVHHSRTCGCRQPPWAFPGRHWQATCLS